MKHNRPLAAGAAMLLAITAYATAPRPWVHAHTTVPGTISTVNVPDGHCHEDDPCFTNPGATQGDAGIVCPGNACSCPTPVLCQEWQPLLAPNQDLILTITNGGGQR